MKPGKDRDLSGARHCRVCPQSIQFSRQTELEVDCNSGGLEASTPKSFPGDAPGISPNLYDKYPRDSRKFLEHHHQYDSMYSFSPTPPIVKDWD